MRDPQRRDGREPRPRWRWLVAAVVCCAAGAAALALDGLDAVAVVAFAGASWALMVFLAQRRAISLLATLTVAGAAVAVLLVDEPPRRFGFGVAVTACAALCAGVWLVGWRRDGGRLTLPGRLAAWLRKRWLMLLIVVVATSIAVAAALHAPPAVIAVLVGLLHALLLARLRHPPATLIAGAIAAAIVVALLAYVPSLPIALLIAVAVWIGYLFIFVRGLSNEKKPEDVREGLMQFSGRILVSALLLVGALVGLGLAVGALIGRRTTPLPFEYVQYGVVGLAVVITLVVCWWWRSYVSIVQGEDGGYLVGLLLGLVVVGLLFVALDKPSRSDDRSDEDKLAARDAVNGRFDLLLAVDPADPVGRMLIRRAQRDVRPTARAPDGSRAGAMFVPRHLDSTYDVAYGIVVPERRNGRRALWRLVEPPTTNVREVELSLASLSPRRRPATGSYGRLLSDVGSEWRVGWRPGARRGIAFLLDRLPTPVSLGMAGRAARRSCDALIAEHDPGRRRVDDDPAVARPWADALAEHCLQRDFFRLWHNAGRLPRDRTPPPVALHAATREQREPVVTAWTSWTTALGGRLNGSRASEPLSEELAVALVRDATDLHTGVPLGQLADAARAYRPVLKFDRDDPLRPADIDWLLGPDRRPPPLRVSLCASDVPREEQLACRQAAREPDVQRVCERGLRKPACDDITTIQALAGSRDDFIDFAGDGNPPPTNEPDPPRMYVHVRQEGRFVFLGYWWFFRYNSSPWLKESNCLPVLSVGEITCHDHEGDWEGITVVLERRDGALHPAAGVYDAHGTAVRWGWEELERRDRRPVVYVAAGSHASYPRACSRAECDQRLRGKGLGEGGFDGLGEWPFNEDSACDRFTLGGQRGRTHGTHGPCLMALPSMHDVLLDEPDTPDIDEGHRGVLWNAFWGSWGRDRCTAVGRACAQVDGPLSPSRQTRFLQPRCWQPGLPGVLARYPRAKEAPGTRGAAPEKSPGVSPRRLCAG